MKKERGVIKYIIIFLAIILILSYFGFDLKKFMNSDSVQNNLKYIWDGILNLWGKYLQPIYDYLANIIGPKIAQILDYIQNNNNPADLGNFIPKIK